MEMWRITPKPDRSPILYTPPHGAACHKKTRGFPCFTKKSRVWKKFQKRRTLAARSRLTRGLLPRWPRSLYGARRVGAHTHTPSTRVRFYTQPPIYTNILNSKLTLFGLKYGIANFNLYKIFDKPNCIYEFPNYIYQTINLKWKI